jgi:hypothetical protein
MKDDRSGIVLIEITFGILTKCKKVIQNAKVKVKCGSLLF